MSNKAFFLFACIMFVFACTSSNAQEEGKNNPGNVIQVKVVSLEGCTATPPTISLIDDTARELGLMVELQRVIVRTTLEAETHRHIGSPTVQFNGLDIDPSARDIKEFGIT